MTCEINWRVEAAAEREIVGNQVFDMKWFVVEAMYGGAC